MSTIYYSIKARKDKVIVLLNVNTHNLKDRKDFLTDNGYSIVHCKPITEELKRQVV